MLIPTQVQETPVNFSLHTPTIDTANSGASNQQQWNHNNRKGGSQFGHSRNHHGSAGGNGKTWDFERQGFAPQPSLLAHLPIESALSEYQKAMTASKRIQDQQEAAHGNTTDDEDDLSTKYFSPNAGPYVYENGTLKQNS
jgi:hypothetical protein